MKIKLFNLVAISVLLIQCVSADITLEDVFRDTIVNDVTLAVPSEYADIDEALLFLDDKRIAEGVTVTIQVADGTYDDYPTIYLDHPYGSRIEIIGNTTSPGSVVLNFTGRHAINMTYGNTIGLIDGFTFVGDQSDYHYGINIDRDSSIVLGPNMIINNFSTGIVAWSSSTVYADGITILNCKDNGVMCSDSTVMVRGSLIQNNGRWGLDCYRTGFILADDATIENNILGSIHVGAVSMVEAMDATISGATSVDPKGELVQ